MKLDFLSWAALAAAIVVTASAEYELARACGFHPIVAAGVPAALDIYAVRALRARRDVLAVVAAMILVNAASHLVSAGLLPVNAPLVVAVSAIAPLVLWRVHRLAHEAATEAVQGSATTLIAPPAVTVERADVRPLIRVPEQVPHHEIEKGYKGPLPAPADTEADTATEPSAVEFLAVRHRVRPDQIRTIAGLLADTPALTGTAAAKALVVSDRQGRRVLAAAKELTGVRT